MQKELDIEPKRLQKHLPLLHPPVKRDPAFYKDSYQSSFLLSFNLKKQNDDKLKQIMFAIFLFFALFLPVFLLIFLISKN